MFARLGIAGRLLLIAFLLLFAASTIGVALGYLTRAGRTGTGLRLPVPDQVAAIVELLEGRSGAGRKAVLRAANTDFLNVALSDGRPPEPKGFRRMPGIEWFVDQYFREPGRREVEAFASDRSASGEARNKLLPKPFDGTVIVIVALQGGGYATFTAHGEAIRVFGLPPGFWLGIIGAIIGIWAVRAIIKEARPLQSLAASVRSFASDAKPVEVEPEGARETRALISAVNEMQAKISELLTSRTLLLGAISHDLKTYLTRLRLRVEDLPSDRQREMATRDLDDMTVLIETALAAVRATGAMPHSMEPLSLKELLEAEVQEREAPALSLLPPGDPATIMGDPIAIRRLIANLIGNALRFGTHCRLSVTKRDGAVLLCVEDDGPGIPKELRSLVFQPFFRVEASRNRDTGGTGLGLAIVKQIAGSHKATVSIGDSTLGGACFTVRFAAA